jgi:hypothetical protein
MIGFLIFVSDSAVFQDDASCVGAVCDMHFSCD